MMCQHCQSHCAFRMTEDGSQEGPESQSCSTSSQSQGLFDQHKHWPIVSLEWYFIFELVDWSSIQSLRAAIKAVC